MRVAVAMALYNGAKYIEAQLDSIRMQTQEPDCVVMCDDGSKDGTVELVKNYINKYDLQERWILIENETNLGYINNFYRAIELCDADLVYLSDQDDVWDLDKISKMTEIMISKTNINLLSCKYGIIDTNGEEIKSFMERKRKEDFTLNKISMFDVLKAYRWPGMVMCVRKSFFEKFHDSLFDQPIPHDLALIVCAAEKNSFYEYNYIGAYHRRHDNNLAREEHRIFKLLNLQRKMKDIAESNNYLQAIINAKLPLNDYNYDLIKYKFQLQEERKRALQQRSFKLLVTLYKKDSKKLLRLVTFLCDVWLLFFGKYK